MVGGGVAGLTAAYLLLKEGFSVMVVEKERVGAGESSRSTAQLGTALDGGYARIRAEHGAEGARIAADSHRSAIDRVERIVREERIACGFERLPGYLIQGKGPEAYSVLKEAEEARAAGLEILLLGEPVLPSLGEGPWLRYSDQAQLDPVDYLLGLARSIALLGGVLHEGTRVLDIASVHPNRVMLESGAVIVADHVLVATNTPVIDRVVMHTKQAPYRTYVIAAPVPKGSIPRALYWDTEQPYHYARLETSRADCDLLIVGGEDHRTGQDSAPEIRYQVLERWARRHFPDLGPLRHRWSGQVLEPSDHLGYAGHNPADIHRCLVITGGSGNGITHATLGARIVTDLIAQRPNPWTELYDPGRAPMAAISGFVRENRRSLAPYGDWFDAHDDVDTAQDLMRGQAAILSHGLQREAAYRDLEGRLHRCSAVCPHLGAIVRWNESEKSWDCPAHGSRFDCDGKSLMGPANRDLAPARSEPQPAETSPLIEPRLATS